ncbi:peptidase S8/S53 domain-containing protein [Mycena crocata]|nr:peptidase S8/S53 domain-containing protein [Mycena crocata]
MPSIVKLLPWLIGSLSGTFFNDATSSQVVLQDGRSGHINASASSMSPDDAPWYLARLNQADALDQDEVFKRAENLDWPFTRNDGWGTGVLVYVIDSGVRRTHEQFARANDPNGKVQPGFRIQSLGGGSGDTDLDGHGTGVAAIIAGKNTGVAKSATIIPIKISNEVDAEKEIPETTAHVTEGIRMALAHFVQQKATNSALKAVINISWVIRRDDAASAAIRDAVKADMHVVIAAGNDHANQPDGPRFDKERVAPSGQITVSGTLPDDSWWFNCGKCVDLVAPSTLLWTATSFLEGKGQSDNLYRYQEGTSFATPMVSGVIAAILSSTPDYISPADMKQRLLRDFTVAKVIAVPEDSPNKLLQAPRA